jgi:phage shock protein A
MSVWSKLITAVRGGANELGEAVIDSQALRILDQEIRDADEELKQSKEALATIMAKQKLADGDVKTIETQIAEYEGYAIKALNTGNEPLALEVAEKIARQEDDLAAAQALAQEFGQSVASLRSSISQAENNIKRLKQQIDTVKATESVQKAQMTVANRYGGSQAKLQTALDSLDRIKKKQAEEAARIEVSAELAKTETTDELDAKLRASGIIRDHGNADDILARLKAKVESE